MRNRSHSKISKLDPEVRETVDEMIKTGFYYREIVDYIKSEGTDISLAAVGNYAKNLMDTLYSLRMAQENFRAILEETERYPDMDVTDGLLRILSNQLLTAVTKIPEEQLEVTDVDKLAKNIVAVSRAVAYKKNIDIKNKSLLENGAEQFKDMFWESLSKEKPELYKELKAHLKQKQEELS